MVCEIRVNILWNYRISIVSILSPPPEQTVKIVWGNPTGKERQWVHLTLRTSPYTSYEELKETLLVAFADTELNRLWKGNSTGNCKAENNVGAMGDIILCKVELVQNLD